MSEDLQKVTYFGETDSRHERKKFGIKAGDRSKHVYIVGKTGMGKSTLLENMAIQDIQSGNGVVFIDPHGGTAEKLLEYVPKDRVKDVLYLAPFDIDYPVAFNVMEDVGPDKRHLVVSGLMSAFMKLFGEESFSDRMQYILQNTILALLEYPGSTMLGINKMLSDKEYRNKVIANITDPSVKAYWTQEYAGYTERFAAEAIPAIQNKIGQFTSNPLIRNIIGQPKSSFNFRTIMDEKKIVIANLSKGRVGEDNAKLLGSMLVTKIYLAAMSRADESAQSLSKLPQFYLFVDEFQNFADKSFADILSEARKYKLNLTMANQYITQMEEEVRDAVFGNVGTMMVFRVGANDAELLEKEFAPVFTAVDLVNLGLRQIYLKLMIDNLASQPFSATTLPPIAQPPISYVNEIIESSRKTFANERLVVEQAIIDWLGETKPPTPKAERVDRGAPKEPVIKYPKKDEPSGPQPIDPRSVAQKEVAPIAPKLIKRDDVAPVAKVSLEELKKKENNQRKPEEKNVSALRDALKAMVAKQPAPKAAPAPAPKAFTPAPPSHSAEASRDKKPEAKKEPSTEELKKLLGVE